MATFNYNQVNKAATKLLFPDLSKLQKGAKQIQNLNAFSKGKKPVNQEGSATKTYMKDPSYRKAVKQGYTP